LSENNIIAAVDINKYKAVLDFIKTYPQVGDDLYFNFIDETNTDGNTALLTVPYGQLVRQYVDGMRLKKMQFEIRQVKPLEQDANTSANAEEMQAVKDFLDWINEQGEARNFPNWGTTQIVGLSTSEGVEDPSLIGVSDNGALYAFPFDIIYIE
jgi:hypothetical protein